MDIHFLFKRLGSIRAVAKQTGYSHNTVRRMLRSDSPPVFDKSVHKTGIDDFADYLIQRFIEHGLSTERLLAEIRPYTFIEHLPRKMAAESMVSFRSSRCRTANWQ